MTPDSTVQATKGTSPALLALLLLAILGVCAGVVYWDQTRPAASSTVGTPGSAPGKAAPSSSGTNEGFDKLK